MKIEKVKNEDIRKFDDLTTGDAFRLPNHFSSDLYIKTYDFEWEGFPDEDGNVEVEQCNAIKLSNGQPIWFPGYEKVVVPICKIMVE